jgi:hypothetical protein
MCSLLWLGNENIFVAGFFIVGTGELGMKAVGGVGNLSAANTNVLAGSKNVSVRIALKRT